MFINNYTVVDREAGGARELDIGSCADADEYKIGRNLSSVGQFD